MNDIPTVRLDVTLPAERLSQLMMVHRQSIETAMREGVEQAVASADWRMIAQNAAREGLQKAIQDAVSRYFDWGDGRKEVEQAVALLLQGVATAAKGETSDGG